ncbi:MAG: FecR family protein [Brevinematia bacterium]
MKKFISLGVLFVGSFFAYAQVDKYPYVEVVIGDVQYSVSRSDVQQGVVYKDLESGITIPLYSIVRTGPDGYAEIKLAQNKTIKVYSSTTISLAKFQAEGSVELGVGKVRAPFRRILSGDEFKIRTDTGIAAVRGTDFGVIYSRGQGNISLMEVFVREGVVNLSTIDGRSVDIPSGYSSSVSRYLGRVDIEDPKPISMEDFNRYFPEQSPTAQELQQPSQKQLPQPSQQPSQVPSQGTQPPTPSPQSQPKPDQSGQTGSSEPKFDLGWEVSSQNINGVVWNKILLSPIFRVGKFGIGLYIVSYWDGKNNIYDTTKWYNSQEYDFGFIADTFVFTDFLDDLSKKILFISYGAKREKVFIRLGSISDMTLGHGFLMDRYSNMLGFPAIRKIGAQFDIDFGYFGFETAIADVSRSRLFGGRIFLRPLYGMELLGNIALGISGVADLEPFVVDGQAFEGNPAVFSAGVDIDFPVFDIGILSLMIFVDLAKMGIYINDLGQNPYLGNFISHQGYTQGFNFLRGEGFSAGISGSIIGLIPYRVEYRRTTGKFIPSYFDALYDVQKVEKLITLMISELPPFNGVLGYSGIYVSNVGEATVQYEQLWPEGEFSGISVNRLISRIKVSKDLVKMVLGIPSYANVTYQRNNIPSAQVFFEDVLRDSTVAVELGYSVDPTMDVSILYKRFYISSTEYQDSVSIQLRSSIFGEIEL